MNTNLGSFGQLHHIEINVADLARSLEFWKWFLTSLGYREAQRWSSGASFQLGVTYLVFTQTASRFQDLGYHRSSTGLNHLAFFADSPATVDRYRQALRKHRVPLLYEDRYPHAGGPDSYAVFFEDPDRIKVELAAPSADTNSIETPTYEKEKPNEKTNFHD